MFGKSLVFLGAALLGASLLAGCGGSATQPVSVIVATTASTVDATDSVTLTATVNNDKTSGGVSWSVSGGGTLSNTTTGSAVYTAPAASSSPLTVTATATSIGDTTKAGSVTLTVPAAPSITTTANQLASSVGAAYSVTLAGSGGIGPYTWTATGLPSCLTLNKTTGVLSGTILGGCAGTSTPTFTMTDSGTATALTGSAQLSLVIATAPAIGFTGSMPSTATYNAAYSGSAAASGGVAGSTLTYSATGTWPSWLSLNSSTGAVSGTPAAIGAVVFSVQAADAYGDTASHTFTVTVGQATPTIGISNLPGSGVYGGGFTPVIANSGNGAASVSSNSATICTASGGVVSYVGVGSCSLTASTAATADYAAATTTATIPINPAALSITASSASVNYGASIPAISPSYSGFVNGDTHSSLSTAPACSTTYTATSAPGSYPTTCSGAVDGNYAFTYVAGAVTVGQVTPTISISNLPGSGIYGGSFAPAFANSGNGAASVSSNTANACTVSGGVVSYVGVGTCSLTASAAATADYTAATAAPVTFSINPAALTVTASNSAVAFGSPVPTITPSYSGFQNGDTRLSLSTSPTCSTTYTATSALGSYPTSCTGAVDGNYTFTYVAGAVTVGQATPTVGISNLPGSGIYGGGFTPAIANSGNGAASVSSNTAATCTVSGGVVSYVGVGSCSLTASTAATADYAAATSTVTIPINPAALSITASSASVTYGASIPAISPSYSGFVNGDTHSSLSTAPTCSTTYTATSAPGSYTTTCSGAVDGNYAFTYVAGAVTVSQVTPTISISNPPASGIYGGSFTPAFANSGNGASSASSNTTNTCTVSGGVVSYVGAGSCSLTANSAATTDYAAATAAPVTFTINPAALTVTASSPSVPFGSPVPTITASYSGFVNGDTNLSLSTAPTCSTTYTPTSVRGSYPSSCSGAADGNYAFTYVAGAVSVGLATPTISISNLPGSGIYGGGFTPAIANSGDGAASVSSNTPAACAVSGGVVSYVGVGSCSLTASTAATTDYAAATSTANFTINPAALSITASSASVNYGASIPVISPSYSGFVNGDTRLSLSTAPTCSTTYTATSAPGSYPTTCSGAVDGNYAFTYVAGTVTVSQVTPTISISNLPGAGIYGGSFTPAFANSGDGTASVSSNTTNICTVSGGVVSYAGVGSCSLTASTAATTDYAAATSTANFTINQATLTVTAPSPTVIVGSPVPAITPIYSGFKNGDTAAALTPAPTCATTYTPASLVGSAPTTSCSGGNSSNYSFTYVFGTVTVVNMSITTPPTLPTGYVGSPYQATLAVAGGTSPYTWAVSSGNPPTGLSLDPSTGILSGTPSGPAGTAKFKVSVTDSAQNGASVDFSITIASGVTITTASPLTPGVQNAAYSGKTLTATGGAGAGTYSWAWAAATGSQIPTGLTLNSHTGVIGGTPGVAGTFSIVVTVTDTASNTASTTFSLILYAPLSITNTALPGGTVNTAYTNTQLAATGGSGSYTWSWGAASGSLPAGMTFSGGLLSGTPTTQGSYSVVFTVKDTTLNITSTKTLSLTVAYAPLSITTTTLPAGAVNTLYTSTQLAATGGSGSYTWSCAPTDCSSLPSGMTLSSGGLLSGTPTAVGSYLVQVTVTDATANSNLTASVTINIDSSTLSITTAPILPIEYVNSNYNTILKATGGTGTLTWTLASGSTLPPGLTQVGTQIGGKPTVTGSYTFTIKVTDSATPKNSASATFSLTVVPVLSLTGVTLPQGTVGVAYSQPVTASGGSGSYSWSWAPASGTLPAGLTISSSTGQISGTPTTANNYSVSVTVKDADPSVTGKSASATFTLPIASPLASVSGQISLVNNCTGTTSVPPIAVTLTSNNINSTFQPRTSATDNGGNYSFTNLPADSYTITPSVSTPSSGIAPSSVFYPATQSVTVGSSNLTAENFSVALGYSVSGNVTYGGAQPSGQIYLQLIGSNCGSYGALGTSIPYPFAKGSSFTINGVPPGAYTLQAWMDNRGNGIPNVTHPAGSASGVSVTSDLVSSAAITLSDPTVAAVSNTTSGPTLNFVGPTDQGVAISFSPVTNSSNVEAVTSYQVQWSSDSSFPANSSYSYTFAANGSKGVWILNSGLAGFSGTLTNGKTYYFRASGLLGGNQTAWSAPWGPITIGAPSSSPSTSNVQGTVGLPTINTSTGVAISSYGQLYVGFYDQGTGAIYADRIASPTNPQSYSVDLPDGANYIFFAILDQNNNGLIDTGDITNVDGTYSSPYTIGGEDTLSQYDLAATSSTAEVTTQMTKSGNSTPSYGLNLKLLGGTKLPVAVELSGPSYPYLIAPVDFSACTSCGNLQFDYQPSIASAAPAINDNFSLQVTYSDGSTDSAVYASVTGVGATAWDPVTGASTVAASGLTRFGTDLTQPYFGWTDPNNASDYTYSFLLSDSSGKIVWQVPSSNSHLSGFDSSITSIGWGSDPTGNTSNTPSITSLKSGQVYTWSIQVVDSNGNSSKTQESFQQP